MRKTVIFENEDETLFALGYEIIEKQQMGTSLTETEQTFLNLIYKKVDKQISRLLKHIR